MSNSLPIVVYICRYQDEDSSGKFARFFDSYKRHPAGYEHELFIIKKGFQEHEDTWNDWPRQLEGVSFQVREYPDKHFVFGYIRNLMEEFPDRYILVCNATCEILVDQWLDFFMRHANPRRVLAPMGSYDSIVEYHLAKIECPPWTLRNFIRSSTATRRKWWSSLWGHDVTMPPQHPCYNVEFYYRRPNPHLRTSCFMVPPRLLERIFYWPQSEHILSKEDEHYFEHGKFGLTAQALLSGLEPLVVGADGRSYAIAEWSQSKTYHTESRENLVIGDQHSRIHENAPFKAKKAYRKRMYENKKKELHHFFEQVMSSDTSQIENYFLKNARQHET